MKQSVVGVAGEADLQMSAELLGEGDELPAQHGRGYRGGFQLKREWHHLSSYHSNQR